MPPIQVQKPGNPCLKITNPIIEPRIGSTVTLTEITSGDVYRKQVFNPVWPRMPAISAKARNQGKNSDFVHPKIPNCENSGSIAHEAGIRRTAPIKVTMNA